MGDEKRRADRRKVRVNYRATDAEGMADMHFESSDLSPGGTFLLSDVLLEIGESLELTFVPPGADQSVRVTARVAWVKRFPIEGEPAGMGMQFLSMSEADREALTGALSNSA